MPLLYTLRVGEVGLTLVFLLWIILQGLILWNHLFESNLTKKNSHVFVNFCKPEVGFVYQFNGGSP